MTELQNQRTGVVDSVANPAPVPPDDEVPIEAEYVSEEEDEDPLQPAELQAPLRRMLQAVEGGEQTVSPHTVSDVHRAERNELKEIKALRRLLPFTRGTFSQEFWDPVQLGHCTEHEGRELFNLYVPHGQADEIFSARPYLHAGL